MHKNAMQRLQILEILYCTVEASPKKPWVNIRQINALGDIEFSLTLLKELGQIKQDGFNYRITGAGALVYESAKNED